MSNLVLVDGPKDSIGPQDILRGRMEFYASQVAEAKNIGIEALVSEYIKETGASALDLELCYEMTPNGARFWVNSKVRTEIDKIERLSFLRAEVERMRSSPNDLLIIRIPRSGQAYRELAEMCAMVAKAKEEAGLDTVRVAFLFEGMMLEIVPEAQMNDAGWFRKEAA